MLTHWGRVTHICVSKLTIIGSDNGLSPGRCQAIIWTNAGILLIWPLGTSFSENLIDIYIFSFKKMHLKMSSVKWRPFCLRLNVLITMPLPGGFEALVKVDGGIHTLVTGGIPEILTFLVAVCVYLGWTRCDILRNGKSPQRQGWCILVLLIVKHTCHISHTFSPFPISRQLTYGLMVFTERSRLWRLGSLQYRKSVQNISCTQISWNIVCPLIILQLWETF